MKIPFPYERVEKGRGEGNDSVRILRCLRDHWCNFFLYKLIILNRREAVCIVSHVGSADKDSIYVSQDTISPRFSRKPPTSSLNGATVMGFSRKREIPVEKHEKRKYIVYISSSKLHIRPADRFMHLPSRARARGSSLYP